MKQRWIKVSFFALSLLLPVVLFVVLLWVRWMRDPRVDEMERQARQLSGWRAIDCGRVRTNIDDSDSNISLPLWQAQACMVSAFRAHRAFRMRRDEDTMDSTIHYCFVRTPRGDIYTLHSETGSATQPLARNRWKNPVIVTRKGREFLTDLW